MPELIARNAAPFLLEGGQDAVLLIHGFTGSAGHMRPLGDALHQAGFTVQGILLPGHGTTTAAMQAEGGAGPWKEASFAAYRELRAKYRTVSVMGLSMGGLLTLILAEAKPAPTCIVTFAAAILLANRLAPLAPVMGLFTDIMEQPIPPERGEDFLNDYDVGYSGTPVRCISDLRQLSQEARHSLGEITCPALIVQSKKDPTVRPKSAQVIYDEIGSAEKKLLWLEKSGHVVTLGPERDQVFQASVEWVRRAAKA